MSTLLVTVDALRADHLSQYGYERDTFPVLDELLDAGATKFDAAFANGTNTGISVPSFLTSRYRGTDALTSGPTVASALPDSVTTCGIHSNTYFGTRASHVTGFDTWEDFGVTSADATQNETTAKRLFRQTMDRVRPVVERLGVRRAAERVQEAVFPASMIIEFTVYENAATTTDRALEWLSNRDTDEEFFLWVHYMDPHRPYGIDLDDPAYADPMSESDIKDLMATAGIHADRVTPAMRETMIDLYDSDIRYTSEHISRLFDGLRTADRWDGTDVILTADHGEEFGDHGEYFHRNRPYDELIHVPLVVKSDRGTSGTVGEQRELLDVAPTVCTNFGVDPPERFRGRDVFEGGDRRVVATGSFRDSGPVAAVRDDGWKYIDVGGSEPELYDLSADPAEETTLASDESDRVAAMRSSIPSHLLTHGNSDLEDDDVSGAVEDRLEELGYLE